VLGNIGAIGAATYGSFSFRVLFRRKNRWGNAVPAAYQSAARWACLGQLIGASVSGSFIDLGLPFSYSRASPAPARSRPGRDEQRPPNGRWRRPLSDGNSFRWRALVPITAYDRPIRVFVHLAHGFGASQWEAKWKRGEIIGINDRQPYGYFWAREDGCLVEYSQDKEERFVGKLMRLGARALFRVRFCPCLAQSARHRPCGKSSGPTLNRRVLGRAAAVPGRRRARRPKLIAQSVWLLTVGTDCLGCDAGSMCG